MTPSLSSKCTNYNEMYFFKIPKLIIFGTHDPQTFKENRLINKLLLMLFYLINICNRRHHRKWQKLRVTLPVNMFRVPNFLSFTINAVLCPTVIHKLCYKLPSIVTFTFIQIFDQSFVFFTKWRQSCRICLIQHQNVCNFRCPVW